MKPYINPMTKPSCGGFSNDVKGIVPKQHTRKVQRKAARQMVKAEIRKELENMREEHFAMLKELCEMEED